MEGTMLAFLRLGGVLVEMKGDKWNDIQCGN